MRLRGLRRQSVGVQSSEAAAAASVESDAFICYSRRDREFVERLHTALVEGGKRVYVDWEDIPDWSPDYADELMDAITACDSFLYVLSPDALASSHCELELDRAVQQGKRIRPLKWRSFDGAVPESLRQPQWIDFSRGGEFGAAVARLVAALGVDADWVHRHTRLSVRATEWDRSGRDASILLRGADLRAAEHWRDEQAGKEPPPTDLQLRYLNASRRAATRRQRATFATVLIVLAAAVALSVFALLQRNQAITQRDRAISLALASAADEQLGIHPDVSLLLSFDAYRASPTAQTRSSVISALEGIRRSGAEAILHGHTDYVSSVAFSPDGRTLVSASGDGTFRLWDVHSHRQLGQPLRGHTDYVTGVAFSPDGRTLASASAASADRPGTVRLWDARSHRQLGQPLRGHTDSVESVAFSPDGRTLASASYDGTVRLWDTRSHRQLGQPLRGHTDYVNGVAFSPDGRTLASASSDGTLRLWDTRSHRQLGQPLRGNTAYVSSVAFSRDGRMLASGGGDGTLRLWDTNSHAQLGSFGVGVSLYGVAFSPDRRTLASASYDGTVRLWDIESPTPLSQPLRGHTNFVWSVAFSPDGRTLASASSDRTVRLWDVHSRTQLGRPLRGHTGPVYAVAFSPDGQTLASVSGDRTVRLWDVHSHTQLGRPLRGHTGSVESVAFSPDGRDVASGSIDHTVRLWDTHSHAQLGQPLRSDTAAVRSVAFSPDGRTLASASGSGMVRLWDVHSHKQLGQPLRGHTGSVWSVAFSPDGRTLASAAADRTVRLWDVHSHRQLGGIGEMTAPSSKLGLGVEFPSGRVPYCSGSVGQGGIRCACSLSP
jgi:WD40 repeat protein